MEKAPLEVGTEEEMVEMVETQEVIIIMEGKCHLVEIMDTEATKIMEMIEVTKIMEMIEEATTTMTNIIMIEVEDIRKLNKQIGIITKVMITTMVETIMIGKDLMNKLIRFKESMEFQNLAARHLLFAIQLLNQTIQPLIIFQIQMVILNYLLTIFISQLLNLN